MDPASPADIHTRMIKRLSNLYPAYKIMYTIPAMGSYMAPWSTVLTDAGDKIDYVQNLFYDYYWLGYNLDTDLVHLLPIITAKGKIVIGIMPGCHDAESEPNTTVPIAKDLATKVKTSGYAGIAIWSANRDTDVREGFTGCPYLTGETSGKYIAAVSSKF
jgi:hypothetical protein